MDAALMMQFLTCDRPANSDIFNLDDAIQAGFYTLTLSFVFIFPNWSYKFLISYKCTNNAIKTACGRN
jgi:hypothetical protein